MVEGTQPNLSSAHSLLQENPEALSADERRSLVKAVADAILCRNAGDDPAVTGLLDLLVGDSDWSVRLEVARTVHLLDDEACSRYVAMLRKDCNSYVRSHAERGLARQRKALRTSKRKRSERRSYSEQLDELARRYGKQVAAKVQDLADQRYAMLAAAVAHDVRSILTTLSPNAAALAKELGAIGRAGSILEDVEFLRRTIEAMEQFSKPLPDHRHPEDLHEMVRHAIEKAWAGVVAQGHDPSAVEVDADDVPSVRLRVTRRLIVFALTNVIQNAIESFADREVDALRPGRVEVQVVVDGYETRIFVRDNGPGLEPEVLKELVTFMPTGPNKSKRSSSGWGLSLVHKYITAHGGSVAIDSEINQGATVVVALPMRDSAGGDDE